MYRRFFKRILDFVVALVVLLVISPVLLVVTVWLHFANRGAGAFFLQERPGLHGKIFKIIKFKTMTDERDAEGNLLPDAERLTPVGRFVRSTSIDESLKHIDENIQTIGIAAPEERARAYAEQATRRGVMRLPQIGRMLNFEMPWDGVFLMDRLVRWNTLWGPLR